MRGELRAQMDAIEADVNAALAAVTPPLFSLAVQRVLEIAERIARDAGRNQVELDDIRRALEMLR